VAKGHQVVSQHPQLGAATGSSPAGWPDTITPRLVVFSCSWLTCRLQPSLTNRQGTNWALWKTLWAFVLLAIMLFTDISISKSNVKARFHVRTQGTEAQLLFCCWLKPSQISHSQWLSKEGQELNSTRAVISTRYTAGRRSI